MKSDGHVSNMLTITFATRTDSTLDPLTKRALELNTEFMALTGELQFQFHLSWQIS
jgi:hypothetical protein